MFSALVYYLLRSFLCLFQDEIENKGAVVFDYTDLISDSGTLHTETLYLAQVLIFSSIGQPVCKKSPLPSRHRPDLHSCVN